MSARLDHDRIGRIDAQFSNQEITQGILQQSIGQDRDLRTCVPRLGLPALMSPRSSQVNSY